MAGAWIDDAVRALRPDYRVLLVAAEGITPAASDRHSEARLQAAREAAREAIGASRVAADHLLGEVGVEADGDAAGVALSTRRRGGLGAALMMSSS